MKKAEVIARFRTPEGLPEMHRRRDDEVAFRFAEHLDRTMWRDIQREFNFKAAMRGKAMIKKRAEKAR
jgi:hypothetical protein